MPYLNAPRVLFAAERTLLAWNRTAVAMISLGFVVERFGLFVNFTHPNPVPGQRELSFWLGMASLSGLVERAGAPLWDRFGMLVYKRGIRFYNFEGLRLFKEKFDPIWEPRYLATTRRGLNPYVALADIGALTCGGFSGMFRK